MLAFILWNIASIIFISIGISCFFSKKAVGFFANESKPIQVKDIKGYNFSVGKLWICFGILFSILSIPLLLNHIALILIVSTLGSFVWVMMLILLYLRIEKKYK